MRKLRFSEVKQLTQGHTAKQVVKAGKTWLFDSRAVCLPSGVSMNCLHFIIHTNTCRSSTYGFHSRGSLKGRR